MTFIFILLNHQSFHLLQTHQHHQTVGALDEYPSRLVDKCSLVLCILSRLYFKIFIKY